MALLRGLERGQNTAGWQTAPAGVTYRGGSILVQSPLLLLLHLLVPGLGVQDEVWLLGAGPGRQQGGEQLRHQGAGAQGAGQGSLALGSQGGGLNKWLLLV